MAPFTSESLEHPAQLKIIGVGGGGGNTVMHMLESQALEGIDYISANTDQQTLLKTPQRVALAIGNGLTKGLGAGANPEIGRQAAEESREDIRARLAGADMVFITAGMGGGTGTGAAPVVAQIAREEGMLTVAVVTRPFVFEGGKRKAIADQGIAALAECVDSLIVIPNERLLPVLGKNTSLLKAFAAVNDVLRDGVAGIAEMITSPGMINVDFADVKAVMSQQGRAKIGVGTARGESRATEAALAAVNSPLLEELDISGARGVLVNITAGPDLTLGEFNEVGEVINQFAGNEATVVIGTSVDMDMSDTIRVSIVAAGLNGTAAKVNTVSMPAKSPPELTHRHRKVEQPASRTASPSPSASTHDQDYLDIPAFLRRDAR
ncbi:cell division protein FtsZ [Vreelandella rituensis]|uniref:Cell division protein FtsZ n=1 Tax=Vreelandella rituensis TaxID=2282306 RepID=A0A368UB47_9GAMM|nr:cell division protein FtsZ [Halomonas rituensis]RCV93916.1 cell division protein FtsZ [Halomonas rituensis]